MLVSILIPVFNREKYIEETVRSAMSQTYKDIEIIIVDNKSTDFTWDIILKLADEDHRIKIFQNKKNVGPVKNWKRCIDEATGIYAKILWSDDLISKNFIEKTLPYLEENNDVGFVFSKTDVFCENFRKEHYKIGQTDTYSTDSYIKGILFGHDYPASPGCALFRLNDLKKNLLVDIPNKVDSDFSIHAIGNDLLIFLLTAKDYKKFVFINEILSHFRSHSDSITMKSSKDGKLVLYYNLAMAYFVENYKKHLIRKLNAKILLLIIKYRNNCYGFKSISDFYIKNRNFSLDYLALFTFCSRFIRRKFIEMIN